MMRTSAVLALAALCIAGCGGGGGAPVQISAATAPGEAQPQPQGTQPALSQAAPSQVVPAVPVQVRVTFPGTPASAAQRRPQFVSASTNGVLVSVYAHSDTTHANLLASSVTDVSSGSAACGGTTGLPRTCTIGVSAPIGADDFTISLYDAPPVSGSFAAAHLLGSGSVGNRTIAAGTANAVNVTIGGAIASLGSPIASSVVANSSFTTIVPLAATDADGNIIAIDPYLTAITLSLAEIAGSSGGTGHSTLIVDGTNVGLSGTLVSGSDTLAVHFDGGGGPGYHAVVTLKSGSASTTVTLDPFFISGSAFFTVGATPVVAFTGAGQTSTITLSEFGYTFSSASLSPPSCGGIATLGTVSGNAFTLTAGATSGSCLLAASDTSIVRNITITNSATPPPAPTPLPNPSASSSPAASASPTLAPTATPTPVASPTLPPQCPATNASQITISPQPISFGGVGASNAVTETISSTAGSISGVTSLSTSVFTLSGSGTSYTLTPVAIGTTAVKVVDSASNQACALVDVHTTNLIGSGHGRRP